jgi:hypothetical protein
MNTARTLALMTLAIETVLLCGLLFLMDHDVNGIGDLLRIENLPAFLIYGIPLWLVFVAIYRRLQVGRVATAAMITASGAAGLAGFLWLSGSQASRPLGQPHSFLILFVISAALLSGGAAAPLLINCVRRGFKSCR